MRSLIDILELSTAEIDELIAVAEDIIANPEAYSDKCRGKILGTLFLSRPREPGSALPRR